MNIVPVFTQADERLFVADWLDAVPHLYVEDDPVQRASCSALSVR
jgi:hypothetical protein